MPCAAPDRIEFSWTPLHANLLLRRTPMANESPVAACSDIHEQAVQHTLAANPLVGVRGQDILASAGLLLSQMLRNPAVAGHQCLTFVRELGRIATGGSELAPDAKDRRFADPAWKQSVAYRTLAQGYLAWGNALYRFLDEAKIDKRDAERARFVISLVVDAMSPTNSLAGNPAALKKLLDTGGASVLHGLENFVSDLVRNGGLPAQVDTRSFTVGKNLAATPGSVVYRSPVMELIQYRPMGDQVHQRPLLIVPPQINKFYVFDLAPEKSIIQIVSRAICKPSPSAGRTPPPPNAISGSTPTSGRWRNPWMRCATSPAVRMSISGARARAASLRRHFSGTLQRAPKPRSIALPWRSACSTWR